MKRPFTRLIQGGLLATAGALFLSAMMTAPADATPPVLGKCAPTAVAFSAANATTHNSTSTFAVVSQSTVNFVQGGTKASCVIVHFWGNTGGNSTGLYLRVTIDGVSSALPDSPEIARWGDAFEHSDSATFILPSVAPGAHKIQLQLRSSGATQVTIGPYNLIVSYAP